MENLQCYIHAEFGRVRALTINNAPWFVGKDVATALGYIDCDKAVRIHVDAEDKLTRHFRGSGQKRAMTIINESGLYSLIFSSKLESAKRFKKWVTGTVLPSIMRTGSYHAGQCQTEMSDQEIMARALLIAQAQIKQKDARIAALEERLAAERQVIRCPALQPVRADLDVPDRSRGTVDGCTISGLQNVSIPIGEFANQLRRMGVDVGRNRFFAYLERNGYMARGKRREEHYLTPTSAPLGLLEVWGRTLKVTPKGQKYFAERLILEGEV